MFIGEWIRAYINVKEQWKDYDHATGKQDNTIDFLLTAKPNKKIVLCFSKKTIDHNGSLAWY